MFKNLIYLAILLGCLSFNTFNWPKILSEKVNKSISSTFETEEFSLNEVLVNDQIKTSLPVPINNNNLFIIKTGEIIIGYAYVGKAPSMKKEFDYIIMFDENLIIKKSKVLIYREMHGKQIGSQRWLKQFAGKSVNDSLELGKDIAGISGATISTTSMTKATNEVLYAIKILHNNEIL
ncbi:FMN-binding protein [Abyssalbus ytuae]|uniref:FMN-binding protein n=1 Tax=Abyssalbus ytuae TaxID=2926907 RepID=A0A9E6ZTJ9_9FLAO|nr:FMN-binding protein [Abyssalbus ytuae]UOB16441.1 FMN-binding protein [Abyssalbus ytuae]